MSDLRLLAFDTETTGLDFKNDDIIEFAAKLDLDEGNAVVDYFLKTDRESTEQAFSKHHLTKEILKERSDCSREEAINNVVDFMISQADYMFVGMNLPFDMTMLLSNAMRIGIDPYKIDALMHCKFFDVMYADKMIRPKVYGESRCLANLCNVYDVHVKPDHSARNDARATYCIAKAQLMNSMFIDKTSKELNDKMQKFAIEDQKSFNNWLKEKGGELRPVGWPVYAKFL